jgi:hypothetical protein
MLLHYFNDGILGCYKTPSRNALKHLTFPLPLLQHLQLVHVNIIPVATTKECSDRTCLCYHVVIFAILMHVIVL